MFKNTPANAGDMGWIPRWRRSPRNGNPLQYSCLGNPMNRGAWDYSPWGFKESDMTEQLKKTKKCVPHPEPSSLLPPHSIHLGRPSAPAPSIQYHASNLDWRLVSYMILYIFQCHSPKSSHPLPLPQSPKDCSIHQCLFCCLVHRVIVTIFLNSIYMC